MKSNRRPVRIAANTTVAAAIVLMCGFAVVAAGEPQSAESARIGWKLASEIVPRLPVTLELLIGSMLISLAIGVTAAWTALKARNRLIIRLISACALALRSIPFFWLALAGALFAGIHFGDSIFGWVSSNRLEFGDLIRHLIVPASIVALMQIPIVVQRLASTSSGTQTLSLKRALHLAIWALAERLPEIIAACVLVDVAFGWPGEGRLFLNSINVYEQLGVAVCVIVVFSFLTLAFRAFLRLVSPLVTEGGRDA